ncbi:MAG TPA: HD-GYP domain-containing protein [Gaiellaceae bacterium]|jgi:putative nucleotidyltransferase with HDIG domain
MLFAYTGVLCLAAGGLVVVFVIANQGIGSAWAVAVLAALALYAEAQVVPMTSAIAFSVAPILVTIAAVLFGPLAAIIVGVTGLLVDLRPQGAEQPRLRWVTWTASQVLVAGSAGYAASQLSHSATSTFGRLFATVAVAAVVECTVDSLLSPLPGVIRGSGSWSEITRIVASVQFSSLPLNVALIGVLTYVYLHISPWAVVLFGLPAVAAQRLFLLYSHQRETAHHLAAAYERLESANLSFAAALVATLDARDQYTAGHSAAVATYARDIAARMGLSSEDQAKAHLSGLVHDIGKVGLPAGLLEKTGPLTLEERRLMEQHSTIGERILSKVDTYSDIATIVRHHHERFDGFGYPNGLSGDDIPLIARIISVADAYNAMTSDRPYRDAMPSRIARFRLAQAADSQFDTTVVAAFEAILASATDEYRLGVGEGFVFEMQPDESVPLPEVA